MTLISILNDGEWVLTEDINPEGETHSISKGLPRQPVGDTRDGIILTFGENTYSLSTSSILLTLLEEIGLVEEYYSSGWCKRTEDFYYNDNIDEYTVTFPTGIDSSELIDVGWSGNHGFVLLQRGSANKIIWCDASGSIVHEETITSGTPILFVYAGYEILVVTTTHTILYDDSTYSVLSSTEVSTTQQDAMDNDLFGDTMSLNYAALQILGWTNYLFGVHCFGNWYFLIEDTGVKSLEVWIEGESGFEMQSTNELPNQVLAPYQLVIYNDWSSSQMFSLWYADKCYTYYFDFDTSEWIVTNTKSANCTEILNSLSYIDGTAGKGFSDYGETQTLDDDISDYVRMTPSQTLLFTDRAQNTIRQDKTTFSYGEIIDEEDILDLRMIGTTIVILTATDVIYVEEGAVVDQKSLSGYGTPLFLSNITYIVTTTSILNYDIYTAPSYPLTVDSALPEGEEVLQQIENVSLDPTLLDTLGILPDALMATSGSSGYWYVLNDDSIDIWAYNYDTFIMEITDTITLPESSPIGLEPSMPTGPE